MPESIEKLLKMGWYLDTSLFMDFIDRNIRVGFDTAEDDDGHTILHIKASNKRTQMFVPVISNGIRYAFELTKNLNQLRNIQLSNGIKYYYSELTKAEVVRALRKAHTSRDSIEIMNWWGSFCFILGDYQKIETAFKLNEELSTLALDFPIRKNVQDYLHLIISKELALAYVTSDKLDDQIEELKERYYPHIYYWPDIKDKVPVDDIFKIP